MFSWQRNCKHLCVLHVNNSSDSRLSLTVLKHIIITKLSSLNRCFQLDMSSLIDQLLVPA